MAVRAAQSRLVGIPLNPLPHANGSHPAAHPNRGDIEVLGTLLRESPTRERPAGAGAIGTDETLRALRLLALDNLIDIVDFREKLHAGAPGGEVPFYLSIPGLSEPGFQC